jgi:hypothetical protein
MVARVRQAEAQVRRCCRDWREAALRDGSARSVRSEGPGAGYRDGVPTESIAEAFGWSVATDCSDRRVVASRYDGPIGAFDDPGIPDYRFNLSVLTC